MKCPVCRKRTNCKECNVELFLLEPETKEEKEMIKKVTEYFNTLEGLK